MLDTNNVMQTDRTIDRSGYSYGSCVITTSASSDSKLVVSLEQEARRRRRQQRPFVAFGRGHRDEACGHHVSPLNHLFQKNRFRSAPARDPWLACRRCNRFSNCRQLSEVDAGSNYVTSVVLRPASVGATPTRTTSSSSSREFVLSRSSLVFAERAHCRQLTVISSYLEQEAEIASAERQPIGAVSGGRASSKQVGRLRVHDDCSRYSRITGTKRQVYSGDRHAASGMMCKRAGDDDGRWYGARGQEWNSRRDRCEWRMRAGGSGGQQVAITSKPHVTASSGTTGRGFARGLARFGNNNDNVVECGVDDESLYKWRAPAQQVGAARHHHHQWQPGSRASFASTMSRAERLATRTDEKLDNAAAAVLAYRGGGCMRAQPASIGANVSVVDMETSSKTFASSTQPPAVSGKVQEAPVCGCGDGRAAITSRLHCDSADNLLRERGGAAPRETRQVHNDEQAARRRWRQEQRGGYFVSRTQIKTNHHQQQQQQQQESANNQTDQLLLSPQQSYQQSVIASSSSKHLSIPNNNNNNETNYNLQITFDKPQQQQSLDTERSFNRNKRRAFRRQVSVKRKKKPPERQITRILTRQDKGGRIKAYQITSQPSAAAAAAVAPSPPSTSGHHYSAARLAAPSYHVQPMTREPANLIHPSPHHRHHLQHRYLADNSSPRDSLFRSALSDQQQQQQQQQHQPLSLPADSGSHLTESSASAARLEWQPFRQPALNCRSSLSSSMANSNMSKHPRAPGARRHPCAPHNQHQSRREYRAARASSGSGGEYQPAQQHPLSAIENRVSPGKGDNLHPLEVLDQRSRMAISIYEPLPPPSQAPEDPQSSRCDTDVATAAPASQMKQQSAIVPSPYYAPRQQVSPALTATSHQRSSRSPYAPPGAREQASPSGGRKAKEHEETVGRSADVTQDAAVCDKKKDAEEPEFSELDESPEAKELREQFPLELRKPIFDLPPPAAARRPPADTSELGASQCSCSGNVGDDNTTLGEQHQAAGRRITAISLQSSDGQSSRVLQLDPQWTRKQLIERVRAELIELDKLESDAGRENNDCDEQHHHRQACTIPNGNKLYEDEAQCVASLVYAEPAPASSSPAPRAQVKCSCWKLLAPGRETSPTDCEGFRNDALDESMHDDCGPTPSLARYSRLLQTDPTAMSASEQVRMANGGAQSGLSPAGPASQSIDSFNGSAATVSTLPTTATATRSVHTRWLQPAGQELGAAKATTDQAHLGRSNNISSKLQQQPQPENPFRRFKGKPTNGTTAGVLPSAAVSSERQQQRWARCFEGSKSQRTMHEASAVGRRPPQQHGEAARVTFASIAAGAGGNLEQTSASANCGEQTTTMQRRRDSAHLVEQQQQQQLHATASRVRQPNRLPQADRRQLDEKKLGQCFSSERSCERKANGFSDLQRDSYATATKDARPYLNSPSNERQQEQEQQDQVVASSRDSSAASLVGKTTETTMQQARQPGSKAGDESATASCSNRSSSAAASSVSQNKSQQASQQWQPTSKAAGEATMGIDEKKIANGGERDSWSYAKTVKANRAHAGNGAASGGQQQATNSQAQTTAQQQQQQQQKAGGGKQKAGIMSGSISNGNNPVASNKSESNNNDYHQHQRQLGSRSPAPGTPLAASPAKPSNGLPAAGHPQRTAGLPAPQQPLAWNRALSWKVDRQQQEQAGAAGGSPAKSQPVGQRCVAAPAPAASGKRSGSSGARAASIMANSQAVDMQAKQAPVSRQAAATTNRSARQTTDDNYSAPAQQSAAKAKRQPVAAANQARAANNRDPIEPAASPSAATNAKYRSPHYHQQQQQQVSGASPAPSGHKAPERPAAKPLAAGKQPAIALSEQDDKAKDCSPVAHGAAANAGTTATASRPKATVAAPVVRRQPSQAADYDCVTQVCCAAKALEEPLVAGSESPARAGRSRSAGTGAAQGDDGGSGGKPAVSSSTSSCPSAAGSSQAISASEAAAASEKDRAAEPAGGCEASRPEPVAGALAAAKSKAQAQQACRSSRADGQRQRQDAGLAQDSRSSQVEHCWRRAAVAPATTAAFGKADDDGSGYGKGNGSGRGSKSTGSEKREEENATTTIKCITNCQTSEGRSQAELLSQEKQQQHQQHSQSNNQNQTNSSFDISKPPGCPATTNWTNTSATTTTTTTNCNTSRSNQSLKQMSAEMNIGTNNNINNLGSETSTATLANDSSGNNNLTNSNATHHVSDENIIAHNNNNNNNIKIHNKSPINVGITQSTPQQVHMTNESNNNIAFNSNGYTSREANSPILEVVSSQEKQQQEDDICKRLGRVSVVDKKAQDKTSTKTTTTTLTEMGADKSSSSSDHKSESTNLKSHTSPASQNIAAATSESTATDTIINNNDSNTISNSSSSSTTLAQPQTESVDNQSETNQRVPSQPSANNRSILILREIDPESPESAVREIFNSENCPSKPVHCEYALHNSWYVTFKNDEDAKLALAYIRKYIVKWNGQAIMARYKPKPAVPSASNQPPSHPIIVPPLVMQQQQQQGVQESGSSPAGGAGGAQPNLGTSPPVSIGQTTMLNTGVPATVGAPQAPGIVPYHQPNHSMLHMGHMMPNSQHQHQHHHHPHHHHQVAGPPHHHYGYSAVAYYGPHGPIMTPWHYSNSPQYDLSEVFIYNGLTPYPSSVKSASNGNSNAKMANVTNGGNGISSAALLGGEMSYHHTAPAHHGIHPHHAQHHHPHSQHHQAHHHHHHNHHHHVNNSNLLMFGPSGNGVKSSGHQRNHHKGNSSPIVTSNGTTSSNHQHNHHHHGHHLNNHNQSSSSSVASSSSQPNGNGSKRNRNLGGNRNPANKA